MGFNKNNLGEVKELDFVLEDVCRMDFLYKFPNLKTLTLIN